MFIECYEVINYFPCVLCGLHHAERCNRFKFCILICVGCVIQMFIYKSVCWKSIWQVVLRISKCNLCDNCWYKNFITFRLSRLWDEICSQSLCNPSILAFILLNFCKELSLNELKKSSLNKLVKFTHLVPLHLNIFYHLAVGSRMFN